MRKLILGRQGEVLRVITAMIVYLAFAGAIVGLESLGQYWGWLKP